MLAGRGFKLCLLVVLSGCFAAAERRLLQDAAAPTDIDVSPLTGPQILSSHANNHVFVNGAVDSYDVVSVLRGQYNLLHYAALS